MAETTKWNRTMRDIYKVYAKYGHQVTLCDLMLRMDISKDKAEKYIQQALYHYQGETRL